MKNESVLKRDWREVPIVAVDIETSGQYPVVDSICEVAAVRSIGGEITDIFQSLVKPPQPMSDFVIGIHGITNEMVTDAPRIGDIIEEFAGFVGEGIAVGHHSPFDISFLVVEYEKVNLQLPTSPFLCSSLLARNTITGVPNHRLQTMVKHLGLDGGQAHRALDDAKACLQLTHHCINEAGLNSLQEISQRQGHNLWWGDYSVEMKRRSSNVWSNLLTCLEEKKSAEIVYMGGSQKGKPRVVEPVGLVRNPQGDYLVASDGGEKPKRFFFDKISEAEVIYK